MLLDNAACHKRPDRLNNHFLSARTTAILDAGVIDHLSRSINTESYDAYDKPIDNGNIDKFISRMLFTL